MPHYFTRENVRLVDQIAMTRYHIPGIVLMENASRHVADYACAMLGAFSPSPFKGEGRGEGKSPNHRSIRGDMKVPGPNPPPNPLPDRERESKRVLVIVGGGNNGGDALAAARHLHNRNIAVTIALLKGDDQYTGDAKTNLNICRAMKLPIIDAAHDLLDVLQSLDETDLILDGIFGTGLSGTVRSPFDQLITRINRRDSPKGVCPVLAIDIPSGLDCDTGKPLGEAVEAQLTVTFVGPKRGFTEKSSVKYTGRVVVADIGAPRELIEELGQLL